MQLSPGQIIDNRFEVEAMVGEGGLAEVYRVRHRELGRIMALKLLTWRKKSLVERLVLEGRIQAQLNHPNVIAVLDLVRHDGQVGLLMEYVDAENLADYIHRVGATPEDEALELMGPILAAVHAAHAAGITHRDLKPANIMLANVGSSVVPKVADFGIAKVMEEVGDDGSHKTRSGATMGTPGYLAPEQVHDASTIDGRADVFALGAITYELIAGSPAFADADGYIAVMSTATMQPLPLVDRCGGCTMVSAAVHRALEKDVDDRFPTVIAFAEALFANRPDLLARLHGTSTGRVSLSIAPAGEALPATTSSTIAPPEPLPTPITQGTLGDPTVRRAMGGWIAAAVLGTVLLMLVLFAGIGVLVVASQQGGPASTTVPAVVTPVPEPEPVPTPAPTEPVVAPEAPEPVATTAPERAAPTPSPRAPVPDVAPDPTPAPEPEPEPEPVVLTVPATPAPTPEPAEPTPAPVPQPQAPNLTGAWAGKAGSQRIQLELNSAGSTLSGVLTIYAGTQVRTEAVRGTVQPDGRVSFTAGDLSFSGTGGPGGLSGTYMREGAKKSVSWSASPN